MILLIVEDLVSLFGFWAEVWGRGNPVEPKIYEEAGPLSLLPAWLEGKRTAEAVCN